MTNSRLLCAKIKTSGLEGSSIVTELGLSEQAFNKKLRGESEFRVSHINRLRELLHLTNSEVGEIFFQPHSDKVVVDVDGLFEQLSLSVRVELLARMRSLTANKKI